MRLRPWLSVCALAFAALGLGASLASLVDYLGPAATFCAASGCETVRASAWAHPLGIPMPLFGVLYFGAMFALALVARPRIRLGLALAGGAAGVCLIAVQALVIGAWCKLCLVSDVSAVAVALAVSAGATTVRMTAARALIASTCVAAIPLAFTAMTLSATSAPAPDASASTAGSAAATPAPVPDVVVQAQTPGKVTVVEFVDFECPFCRRLAPALATAVHDAAATIPVTVVRKMVPLSMHPHARTAALAWCCADAQGKGDAMAEALFDAPVDELTPEGCEQLAEHVGCDLARYREAFADPATAQRVDDDLASAKAASAEALPTVFVGDRRFVGANHDAAELSAAIDQAAQASL